jgi:hypothetical protein
MDITDPVANYELRVFEEYQTLRDKNKIDA